MRNTVKLFYLTALAVLLTACAPAPDSPAPSGSAGKEDPMDIIAFTFSHSGSMATGCYRYSIEQTQDGVRLRGEALYAGGETVELLAEDDPILEQLGELAGTHRINRWDGFDQTAKHVMDGSGFSLDITLADGGTVSARGSNRFPDGFSDFFGELNRLVIQAFARHGAAAPMAP